MVNRQALLIGVPRYDDGEFSEIGDVVRSDVRLMHDTLEQSGYESVISLGVDEYGQEPTGSRIKAHIKRACADAPAGSVLLLYFSGHGITIDGRDYLVPSDAYRDPGASTPDPDSLVPLVPPNVEHCQARLVVYFVDACRDDPAEALGPAARGKLLPSLPGGDFVVVTGCRAGQRCLYTESGSFFTQALAQALDRRNPARTLEQVLVDVEQQMQRKASRTEGLQQEPEAHYTGTTLPAATTVVCDGDQLTEAWRRAVETTKLWEHFDADPVRARLIREKVKAVVEECARDCGAVHEVLRRNTGVDDPWFDQNYPVRVLEQVSLLLGAATELEPPEAAALIAAPFLRESVLAEGVRLAAGINPANFTRTYETGARSDLETTHEMYQHIVRRAEGLEKRGQGEARNTLAMWLVHQWLAARLTVWRSAAADRAYERGARLLDGSTLPAAQGELPKLVGALVRAVGADPVDQQLVEHLQRVYMDDRWRGLAAVLWVAGILAADPRRMPPVIADHVGTRLELPLTAVTAAADRTEWHRKAGDLDLRMICDHPAMHLALEDVARRAGLALATLRDLPMASALRNGLPERVTTGELRPEQRKDDTPAYQTPVERFRLAEDKVRELLMGRQLYDDPALAIRELYQNALDACRYRHTRMKALRRKGKSPGAWQGKISFRQGADENGREYIECEDNGIGMDPGTLQHVFANAGERFVYRHDYRAEQAEWQDLDPPLRLVSNSQFGVGVFSYFMLADEITVVTRPVGRNGIVSPDAYRVDIASSGSLFQITSSDGMTRGGTLVRMYLTGDEDVSVLHTLSSLLLIAECRVEVVERNAAPEVWQADELHYKEQDVQSLKCGENLWWVSVMGALAADGIRTNQGIFGLVVNLRDIHRPTFTVDRKILREWDRKWVDEEIARSVAALMSWPGLTLIWLWELTENEPRIAQLVFDHLVSTGRSIPLGDVREPDPQIPIGTLGCLPEDQQFLHNPPRMLPYKCIDMWRAGQWARLVGSRSTRGYPLALHTCAEGSPIVSPADRSLLESFQSFKSNTIIDLDTIVGAVSDRDDTVAVRLKRLRRYAIIGLHLSAMRDVPRLTSPLTDRWMLHAVSILSGPRRRPQLDAAHSLVLASIASECTLGDVLKRVADLAPPDRVPPDIDLGPLNGYMCSDADAKLLSRDNDGLAPWISGKLTPAQVATKCTALGRSLEQILSMCDQLAPLGVTVVRRDKYPTNLDALECQALKHVETVGQYLTPLELVMLAAQTDTSVHDVHAKLTRLDTIGLITLPDISALPDLTPSHTELEIIDRYLTTTYDIDMLTSQSAISRMVGLITGWHTRGNRDAICAETLVPFTAPREPLTVMDLLNLSASFACSLGEARERVLQVYSDAQLPTLSAEEAALTPTLTIATTLLDSRVPGNFIWHLGPGDIVSGALQAGQSLGAFLNTLAPYRLLGAPVPELSEATRRGLHDVIPEECDADMLRGKDDFSKSHVSTITPLFLVQVAGQYGWTVAATHERMAKFVPLGLTLEYPVDACLDEIVYWQDLLVVTEYLDGQEPVVQATVSEAHIAWAAEEFDETPERVRERLRRYAPLFGFHVAEDPTSV
ncbi:HD domain-containing protein [Sphaerisporangium viridialbum]|uniref:HD domain-containing protein n=1 Tax=Sphaerisporangium viridialbum TaxID=46189 RepID=UPI003C713E1E